MEIIENELLQIFQSNVFYAQFFSILDEYLLISVAIEQYFALSVPNDMISKNINE